MENAARCHTAAEAQTEILRLVRGNTWFSPGTTVLTAERIENEAWAALVDDPEDEYEYTSFTIFDDGAFSWT